MTIQEFANELQVSASTISRWKEPGETVSPSNLEKIYDYAFKKKIRLNKIKAQLFREECLENHVLLFHGAKTENTQRAVDQIRILRRCYLAVVEKEAYISARSEEAKVGSDKVKIARRQYRGQGQYIEDILL